MRCKRCGHQWVPRVDSPQVCPKCKRYIDPRDYLQANTNKEEEGDAASLIAQ